MLKCEQKLLILSFEEEITEVPAGCLRESTSVIFSLSNRPLACLPSMHSLWNKLTHCQ